MVPDGSASGGYSIYGSRDGCEWGLFIYLSIDSPWMYTFVGCRWKAQADIGLFYGTVGYPGECLAL